MQFQNFNFAALLRFMHEDFDPEMAVDDGNRDTITKLCAIGWVKTFVPGDGIKRRFAITDPGLAAMEATKQALIAGMKLGAPATGSGISMERLSGFLDLALEVIEHHGEEITPARWTHFMLQTVELTILFDPEAGEKAFSKADLAMLDRLKAAARHGHANAEKGDSAVRLKPEPEPESEFAKAVEVAINYAKLIAKPIPRDPDASLAMLRAQTSALPELMRAGRILSKVDLKVSTCKPEMRDA